MSRLDSVKIGLAFAIGAGLAFQALPDEQRELFGPWTAPLVSIFLGGLYALDRKISGGVNVEPSPVIVENKPGDPVPVVEEQ